MLLLEGLESLALLCSIFNSYIQFDLGGLGDVFILGFQFLLTINLVVYILTPRHELSRAMEKLFCQFILKPHGVEVDVFVSRGDR